MYTSIALLILDNDCLIQLHINNSFIIYLSKLPNYLKIVELLTIILMYIKSSKIDLSSQSFPILNNEIPKIYLIVW